MSEIRATTISDSAGTGPITLTAQSAAKAWCTFQGTGTAAIKDSFNTASLTDTGTANYTMAFTSSMSDANYNIQYTTHSTGSYTDWTRSCWYSVGGKSATSYAVGSVDETDSWYDPLEASSLIHGDLA